MIVNFFFDWVKKRLIFSNIINKNLIDAKKAVKLKRNFGNFLEAFKKDGIKFINKKLLLMAILNKTIEFI